MEGFCGEIHDSQEILQIAMDLRLASFAIFDEDSQLCGVR